MHLAVSIASAARAHRSTRLQKPHNAPGTPLPTRIPIANLLHFLICVAAAGMFSNHEGMETTGLATEPVQPVGILAKAARCILGGFGIWAVSLFLLGMGMKLLMMQQCVNPVPYFDQWEGEAAAIYVPYYEHVLGISDLFYAQNEHRIVLSHLYDLALLLLNGQWDSQLQMVINAAIHCGTIAGFGWLLAALMGRPYYVFIWLPLALALMSPFGWENALCGFQSCFYLLLLFSLMTIWLLGSDPLSKQWRLGLVTGICALLTMASGLVAFVAVAAVIILDIMRNRTGWRRYIPTLVACGALTVAGLLLKGHSPVEKEWHAQSFRAFLVALGNNLSWPTGLWPWLAPLNMLPLLGLAWIYFRSKEKNLAAERLILGTGVWVILQSVATAYARGFEGRPPTWRYMDTLCLLLIANFLSIILLIGKYRKNLPLLPVWYAAFALWFIPCTTSLWTLNERAWKGAIPLWAGHQQIRLETTRAFVQTNDEKVFANHDPQDLAWFYIPELAFLLRSQDIRPILPACVRDPLKVLPSENGTSAFVAGGCLLAKPDAPTEHCLGSYSGAGAAARGVFESGPMSSKLPYLLIQVAGDLGGSGLALELVELASGKVFEIKAPAVAGPQWLDVYVKAPAAAFKIVARDESTTGWFAFKAPREVGRLSFWAMRTVGAGKSVMVLGFVSLAIASSMYCFQFRRRAINAPPLALL